MNTHNLIKGLKWVGGGIGVKSPPLPHCDWSVSTSIGIIDYSIERLIYPLPEQNSWSSPEKQDLILEVGSFANTYLIAFLICRIKLLVKCHHASSDCHVHWDLCRHPTNQDHLLTGIRVKSRVKNIFGSPQFIFCQPWGDYTLPVSELRFETKCQTLVIT